VSPWVTPAVRQSGPQRTSLSETWGPPEHIKQLIVHIFKTLERAVFSCKTLSHTEVDLAASPDAIWDVYKHVDELLPKYFPEFLLSSTFLKGHGEVGSIRLVKIGPGSLLAHD
jgi:hypothetical protein